MVLPRIQAIPTAAFLRPGPSDGVPVEIDKLADDDIWIELPFGTGCSLPAEFGGSRGIVQQHDDLEGQVLGILGRCDNASTPSSKASIIPPARATTRGHPMLIDSIKTRLLVSYREQITLTLDFPAILVQHRERLLPFKVTIPDSSGAGNAIADEFFKVP